MSAMHIFWHAHVAFKNLHNCFIFPDESFYIILILHCKHWRNSDVAALEWKMIEFDFEFGVAGVFVFLVVFIDSQNV